jgi:tripeptidyl-peptidase-1
MRCSLVALAAVVAAAAAAPSSVHVRHEKRDGIPDGWVKHSSMHRTSMMPMKVALRQGNLDKLDGYLMDVSSPDSTNYGKHWSHEAIAEAFAPSQETVKAVTEWLESAGIAPSRVSQSQSLGWLNFDATVEEAESLLRTEYHLYRHQSSGRGQAACTEYHVPASVQTHIDFITPTVHFDAKVKPPTGEELQRRERPVPGLGSSASGSLPKLQYAGHRTISNDLSDCSNNVTPDCLRALYGIPHASSYTNPGNSFGIVEYTPQSYISTDLDLFFSNFSKNQVQKRPIFDSIDGGSVSDVPSLDLNAESDLDLQYAMALVNPLEVTLYQVGDIPEQDNTSFNNFLDALDRSYCAGDNPLFDATYPDPLPGGYNGPENCGGYAATKVISTSYGYNEVDLTPAYEIRQCHEYAKLGLAGTTFLFSSGDNGVAGNSGQCLNPMTGQLNNGTSGKFNPSFPSKRPVKSPHSRPNDSRHLPIHLVRRCHSDQAERVRHRARRGL